MNEENLKHIYEFIGALHLFFYFSFVTY